MCKALSMSNLSLKDNCLCHLVSHHNEPARQPVGTRLERAPHYSMTSLTVNFKSVDGARAQFNPVERTVYM